MAVSPGRYRSRYCTKQKSVMSNPHNYSSRIQQHRTKTPSKRPVSPANGKKSPGLRTLPTCFDSKVHWLRAGETLAPKDKPNAAVPAVLVRSAYLRVRARSPDYDFPCETDATGCRLGQGSELDHVNGAIRVAVAALNYYSGIPRKKLECGDKNFSRKPIVRARSLFRRRRIFFARLWK